MRRQVGEALTGSCGDLVIEVGGGTVPGAGQFITAGKRTAMITELEPFRRTEPIDSRSRADRPVEINTADHAEDRVHDLVGGGCARQLPNPVHGRARHGTEGP